MTAPTRPIHHAAADGYTSGNTADHYVRGRPDYPPEVASWLRDTLGLCRGQTVVDLGAGTGKFTRRLVETGARVVAVEPVAAMRDKLHSALPEVEAVEGTADALPLADASVDVLVCAQSFHWFAHAAALTEIRRVLRPGGRLGLIWNVRDARVDWVAQLDAIVNRFEGDTPRYYTGEWRKAFPFPGFGSLREHHYSIGHTGSPEDVIVARVRSTSFIGALAPAQQAQIEAEVRALIAGEPALHGQSIVTMPYETAAWDTVREAD